MNRTKLLVLRLSFFVALAICLSRSPSAFAADEAAPEVVRFALHSAPAPKAVLRYRLLPHFIDQTPGNAAVQYMRASLALSQDKTYQDASAHISDWIELPLDQLRKHEGAQNFYNTLPSSNFELIGFAARKEFCEWDLPLREYNVQTHIPELWWLRECARLMALKARMETSRGQFAEAIESIKTGMAIGQHAACGPTLVNGLVGVSVSIVMLKQVEELVQQPNCPSLYWTLTALPSPCIDLRRADETEQDSLYTMLPKLREIDKPRSEEQWNKLLAETTQSLLNAMPKKDQNTDFWTKGAAAAAMAYPKAIQQLQQFGYSKSAIDAMPIAQAILTATVENYERERDSLHRWFYLPYPEASMAMDEEERRVNNADEIIPFGKILLPSMRSVRTAQVRLDREVAALRIVEALRMYAASHHGQLPKQLTDISDAPVPNNPITGKPFDYEIRQGKALLHSPAPPRDPAVHELHWEIEMSDAKK